jgi:HK97 family phage major capsid protein
MTSLSQRIATLQTERGRLVANFEALIHRALDEDRDLDDDENESRLTLRAEIEALDRRIERHSADETFLARSATPVPAVIPSDRPGSSVVLRTPRERPVISMRRNSDYKGAGFTRWAIAQCVAGAWNAAEYARQRWGDDELADTIAFANWFSRAATPPMGTGPGAPGGAEEGLGGGLGGASLIRLEHLGAEFIELLRPMLIVARLPSMRRLQFNGAGTLLIPRQSGGVIGGYVGEGGNIIVERLRFGQLQLTPSKLAVIVPVTNEMLHRADPGIEQLIRDDMLEGTARTIDRVFFSTVGGGTAAAPNGILFGIPQNTDGDIPADGGPGVPNVNTVTEKLKAMILALRMANMPMQAPVWIMNARTKEYLRLLRTQQEIFAFKAEIDAGTLLGYPIIDTTNILIPFPPGTGNQTAYALVDASQLIWAEDMLPMIDASQDASIISSDDFPPSPPAPPGLPAISAGFPGYSAFQNDMTFMRIRMRHTWNRRYDEPPPGSPATARTLSWALTEE